MKLNSHRVMLYCLSNSVVQFLSELLLLLICKRNGKTKYQNEAANRVRVNEREIFYSHFMCKMHGQSLECQELNDVDVKDTVYVIPSLEQIGS